MTIDPVTITSLDDLRSGDKERQNVAFSHLMGVTGDPVNWAYMLWDDLVELLASPNNRTRAIAAQVLCNLAKSDPDERMLRDLDVLIDVTRDQRFVTARHCMQSLWKVGVAGERQRELLLRALAARFAECSAEKNCTLIRYDILESLKKVYDRTGDDRIREQALGLIQTEDDLKYRKKYTRLWPAK